jgi:UPF0176 protein
MYGVVLVAVPFHIQGEINMYNSEVGRFKNAIKMDVDTFRESLQVLDALVADRKKDEAIYMYCTGGIRCSVAGAYISKKGYTNVNMVCDH